MTTNTQECAAISHPDLFILLADHLALGSLVSIRCTAVSMTTAVGRMERWKEGQLRTWLTRLDDGAGFIRVRCFMRIMKMFGTDLESVVQKLNGGPFAAPRFWKALKVPPMDQNYFVRGRHWPRYPMPTHFLINEINGGASFYA